MNPTEQEVREALECGDLDEAASRTLSGYGVEVWSFLRTLVRSRTLADEAFADFATDMWRRLQDFRWESRLRTWCFGVARIAALRQRRAEYVRERRELPIFVNNAVARALHRTRTPTPMHRRTEVKQKMRTLREQLSLEDQMLLILRIDRQLSWREAAHAMLPEETGSDAETIQAERRLRKRFERAKEKLRRLAVENGLIAP